MYQEEENLEDPVGVVPKEAAQEQPPRAETISISKPSTTTTASETKQPNAS
jgi:large subunit ribosomal protein L47